MLRKTVALLIALNLIWWIWAKGWLAPVGLPATFGHNPEFLRRQIHPEALRVQPLPPGTPIIQTVPAASNTSSTAPQATPVAKVTPPQTAYVNVVDRKHHAQKH